MRDFQVSISNLYFLPAILVYLGLIISSRGLRQKIGWLRWGRIDRNSWLLILGLGLISAIALAAWAIFIKKDLSQFKAFIPRAPLGLLALYGLVFPAFNALFEEFMARAVLYDGFERILHHSVGIILSQAVVFAFWHYNGFPGGPIGVAMVFAWSVVLGYLRLRSRGMLAPLLAHYLADFAIVIILYFFVIKS
jgi:membrane protease YdiL (CAAX protease family)